MDFFCYGQLNTSKRVTLAISGISLIMGKEVSIFTFNHAFSIISLNVPLSVTASAANLLIPSLSFSTAMACSLKSKRNFSSLLMYDFFSRLSEEASDAFNFLGTESLLSYSCSNRFGYFDVSNPYFTEVFQNLQIRTAMVR